MNTPLDSTNNLQDNDVLLWIEGVTDLDDVCNEEVSPFTRAFCKSVEQLQSRPYVQINDWKIYKIDYFDHSYNQFYLQINQYTNRARVIIAFKRYQKDKVAIYAEDDSSNLKSIKTTTNIVQITHFKKTIEIGSTITTEELTKTTKMPYEQFLLSL